MTVGIKGLSASSRRAHPTVNGEQRQLGMGLSCAFHAIGQISSDLEFNHNRRLRRGSTQAPDCPGRFGSRKQGSAARWFV